MSNKTMFINEAATAGKWAEEHMYDIEFRNLLERLQNPSVLHTMAHSDRWSEFYDFLSEHYPEDTSLATGLTYYIEG